MFFLLPLQKVVKPIIMKRFNNIFLVIITIFLLNSLCITAQTDSNKPLSAEQLLIKCEHARTKCQYEQLGKLSKQLMVAADGDKRYEAYKKESGKEFEVSVRELKDFIAQRKKVMDREFLKK